MKNLKLFFIAALTSIALMQSSCTPSDYFSGYWKGDITLTSQPGIYPATMQYTKIQSNYTDCLISSTINGSYFNIQVNGIHVEDAGGKFNLFFGATPTEGQIHSLNGTLKDGIINVSFNTIISGNNELGIISNATKN